MRLATDRQIDQLVYALYGLAAEEIRIVEDAAYYQVDASQIVVLAVFRAARDLGVWQSRA